MQQKRIGFLSHLDLNLYLFRLPIMEALIQKGHRVFAICPKGNYSDKLAAIGCEVIHYDIERQGLNPLKELKAIERIYHAIKPLSLDIIHTFTAKPNIYGTFAAKVAKVPVILNLVEGLGSFYIENSVKNRLIRWIMEMLYKQAFKLSNTTVFVNSDDPAYMIEKGIISQDKVRIIKSVGIDTQCFSRDSVDTQVVDKLRDELHVKDSIVVLMVARAIWHKGIKEYYEAATLLAQQREDMLFLLAGDTDEGNISCASEAYLQSGSVKWLGHRDDILELTALSDIYILPSYREGVPRTLLEAASMGKPIVTTDTVGCKEVVDDGENGYLVPLKDAKILADKIQKLAEDKHLRDIMGKKGRIKAEKEFDINAVLEQYMQLYREYGVEI